MTKNIIKEIICQENTKRGGNAWPIFHCNGGLGDSQPMGNNNRHGDKEGKSERNPGTPYWFTNLGAVSEMTISMGVNMTFTQQQGLPFSWVPYCYLPKEKNGMSGAA